VTSARPPFAHSPEQADSRPKRCKPPFAQPCGEPPCPPDDEYLFGYADLVTFVQAGRLLDAPTADQLWRVAEREPGPALAVLEHALQLRGSLDRILRSRLGDQSPSGDDLDVVRQAYVTALTHATLRPSDGHYDWAWRAGGDALDQPLWPLAAHAVDLLRSGRSNQLSRCGHCRWLFLDTSKNHSRRWCSMNSCGSIMKMRRYRAARRF
jgi:predicted RNA-binding Zn ribbon-like protein